MSIVEIPGGVFLPAPIQFSPTGTPGFAEYVLNGTNRKIGFILRVPMSGEASGDLAVMLERFEFMIGAVTQNPTNGLKVSFQEIASGVPVNSADYYYVITTGNINEDTWTIPTHITSDGTSEGQRKEAVHGGLLACVIEFENFVAGDSLVIKVLTQDLYAMKGAYTLTANGAGAWTKVTGSPVMSLVYLDRTNGDVYRYMPLTDVYSVNAIGGETINSTSTPDESGLAFTLPAPMRVGGAYVLVDPDGNFDVVLYDIEANTVLETVRVNTTDYYPNGNNIDYIYVRFTEDFLLGGNQSYVLSVKPASASNVLVYYGITGLEGSTEQMASLPGGATWYYIQRTDDGDWIEANSIRPFFGLQITGVDHDTSGGGGGTGWEGNP